MTRPDDDAARLLVPPPAPEQDTAEIPDYDPQTSDLDPDEQGGIH